MLWKYWKEENGSVVSLLYVQWKCTKLLGVPCVWAFVWVRAEERSPVLLPWLAVAPCHPACLARCMEPSLCIWNLSGGCPAENAFRLQLKIPVVHRLLSGPSQRVQNHEAILLLRRRCSFVTCFFSFVHEKVFICFFLVWKQHAAVLVPAVACW